MVFLIEVPLDKRSDSLLVFHGIEIHHFCISFQWQTGTDGRNWKVVAFGELSAKAALSREYFHFNVVVINTAELYRVSAVNIMKMNTAPGFGQLCVGLGPLRSSLQIAFKRFLSVSSFQIKIDDDMVLGILDLVELGCVQVLEFSSAFVPAVDGGASVIRILGRTIGTNIIED